MKEGNKIKDNTYGLVVVKCLGGGVGGTIASNEIMITSLKSKQDVHVTVTSDGDLRFTFLTHGSK